jgi:aminoglycoside phosphotransferase (APT) family kinase protein
LPPSRPPLGCSTRRSLRTLGGRDAHVGNLLCGPDGDVLLCDFDATCLGPRQVDLFAVGEIRFRRSGAPAALVAA